MEAVQAELARLPRAEVADTREHVSRALCLYAGLMLREQGPQRSQALLLRLRWLQAVLSSGGLSVLLRETERHASAGGGGSATMELLVLASTLRRSATALRGARPEAALPGQLLGRLGLTKSRELPPGLAALVAEAAAWRDAVTLLRPISASLDAPGGALETVLEGHTDTVTALSPAFDGCIASASRDGTLRIWRLWECACEHVLTGHSGLVRSVVLLPGGLLISGGTDCTLRVWDTHSGICNGVIRCQRKVVAMAALSGSDVAVALDDNALRIWSVATRSTSGHVLAAHSDSITSIVLISTFVIASGGLDGLINVWTVMAGTGTLDRTIQAGGKVCSLAALPEGRIASAHLDCTRVWTATGTLAINIPCGKTNRVAALPDGRFATAHDGKIQVWAPDGSLLRSVKGRRAAAVELQGLADGRIASGALDGAVRLWASALSGATQSAREGLPASPSLARGAAACHTDRVSAMVTLVESGRVVTASWDSTLRLWDPATGSCVGVLKGHTNRVTVLRALSTGNLLSASVDSCRLWSGRTGSLEHTLMGHTRPVADAAEVCGRPVTASEDGTLRSWSPVSGTAACVFQGHADRVNACIAVSDDRLVSGSADRTLRLWHAQSGKCLAVLRGHSEGVNCLALLHEGLAVSGSDDHAIAIWNLSNGTCELIMKGGSEPIRSLTLLGDGRVASVGSKETLKIWNVDECLCEHTEHGAFAGTVTPLAASAAGGGVGCFAYAQGSFLATSFGTARFYADDPVRCEPSPRHSLVTQARVNTVKQPCPGCLRAQRGPRLGTGCDFLDNGRGCHGAGCRHRSGGSALRGGGAEQPGDAAAGRGGRLLPPRHVNGLARAKHHNAFYIYSHVRTARAPPNHATRPQARGAQRADLARTKNPRKCRSELRRR